MKQFLLVLILIFICSELTVAQSEYTGGNRSDENYFQNDKIVVKNKIEIYPNPAVENVFVKIENSELEKVEIELFNIIGNSIRFEYEEITKNNFKIKVDEFPPGYYLLIIKDPISRFSQAFKFHKVK